jgi:MFS family permease
VIGNFLAFLCSLFFSKLADQTLLFLVPLVVFQTTNSIAWSGVAFAVETFPRFVSFPICGALCDRISPVKLMRASQLFRAIVCIGGAAASIAFGGVGWLIAISAICGVLTTQGAMAREVILPQVFKQYTFEKVLAYSQTADQTGSIAGPLVAAVLLSYWRWELVVFGASSLFLLADLAMVIWHRTNTVALREPEAVGESWIVTTRTALMHVVHLPGLSRLVILAAGVNLIIGVTLATSAALVTGVHGQSTSFYAGLQMAGALATVLILLVVAHTSMPLNRMGALAFGLILVGGLVTALSPNPWTYAIGFLLVVGFDKMFNIYIRSSRQKVIPVKDYGKTIGVVVMLNNLTQPLAGLAIGLLDKHVSTGAIILILTCAMALMGVIAIRTPPVAI